MIRGRSLRPLDKTVVTAGIAVALLLLAGGILAAGMALSRLDRTIVTNTKALADIGQWRGEAQLLQQQLRHAEGKLVRAEGGALVTEIEGMANRIAGAGSLAYLRPLASSVREGLQLETVELKLERQSLEQVLRLLWELENSPAAPMHIASLRLQRRFENRSLLDATLTVNAYRK